MIQGTHTATPPLFSQACPNIRIWILFLSPSATEAFIEPEREHLACQLESESPSTAFVFTTVHDSLLLPGGQTLLYSHQAPTWTSVELHSELQVTYSFSVYSLDQLWFPEQNSGPTYPGLEELIASVPHIVPKYPPRFGFHIS